MKVSIITVVYNGKDTLRQTIESVLSQDYPSIDYWVIDGGSTDGTLELLKEYEGRLQYISEKDRGIYDGMNRGLAKISGEIVGMVHSGDVYPSTDVIRSVVECFERNDVDSIYGDKQYVDPISGKIVRYWVAGNYKRSNWLFGWMPPHLSFYVKKSVYNRLGGYRLDLSTSADYEWMLRALYKEKISVVYLPKLLVTMLNGGVSNASWMHRFKANQQDKQAWELNELSHYFFTLWMKPLRKIIQLLKRPNS
jgi:glycosyltransferase involved in cell wall biosynthesis